MSSYRKPITTWQGLQGIQGAFLVQSKGQVHGHSALAHTTFTWGGEKALGRGSEGAHPTIKELWFFSDASFRFIYSTLLHVQNEPLSGG